LKGRAAVAIESGLLSSWNVVIGHGREGLRCPELRFHHARVAREGVGGNVGEGVHRLWSEILVISSDMLKDTGACIAVRHHIYLWIFSRVGSDKIQKRGEVCVVASQSTGVASARFSDRDNCSTGK
jgi:hypothetical protein